MSNFIFFNFHRSSITFSPELWYIKLTCHVAIHYCVGVNFVTRYQWITTLIEQSPNNENLCKPLETLSYS